MYPSTSCLPNKSCAFHSSHLGLFLPHSFCPLLIICPHFLSVSIEISSKDSPKAHLLICSVNQNRDSKKLKPLFSPDLPYQKWSFFCICPVHLSHAPLISAIIHIYIIISPASLFVWSLRAETFVPLFHSQNTLHGSLLIAGAHTYSGMLLTTHLTGPLKVTIILSRSCYRL